MLKLKMQRAGSKKLTSPNARKKVIMQRMCEKLDNVEITKSPFIKGFQPFAVWQNFEGKKCKMQVAKHKTSYESVVCALLAR